MRTFSVYLLFLIMCFSNCVQAHHEDLGGNPILPEEDKKLEALYLDSQIFYLLINYCVDIEKEVYIFYPRAASPAYFNQVLENIRQKVYWSQNKSTAIPGL